MSKVVSKASLTEANDVLTEIQALIIGDGETNFAECRRRVRKSIQDLLDNTCRPDSDGDFNGHFWSYEFPPTEPVCKVALWSHCCADCADDTPDTLYVKRNCDDYDEDYNSITDAIADFKRMIDGYSVTFVNLTPHDVTLMDADSNIIRVFPTTGKFLRVVEKKRSLPAVDGIPVNEKTFGKVQDLPAQVDGTVYIVSEITARAALNRRDLYIPDDTVRDENGRIIGCRALAQLPE